MVLTLISPNEITTRVNVYIEKKIGSWAEPWTTPIQQRKLRRLSY